MSGIVLALGSVCLGKASESQGLDFKAIHHAQIGVDKSVFALTRTDKQLFSLPQFSDYFIEYSYDGTKAKAEEAFQQGNRDTAPGQRIRFPDKVGMRFWKGVWQKDGYLWFLDSSGPKVITYDIKEKRWSSQRDIILDLLRPAADSRGEPTSSEIKDVRSQFRKNYRALSKDLPHVYGWAALPPAHQAAFSNSDFFVLSRVKDFPLLVMSCQDSRKPYCQVQRSCNLQLPKGVDQEMLAGVAYSPQRRLLLLGNYRTNEIYIYKASSCYHLPFQKRLLLPKQLHELASLYVDEEDNLWVGTTEPDSYLNASTYRWNQSNW